MKLLALSGGVAIALGASLPVVAADMPVKAPPAAAVAEHGAWYLWVDGSYQAVHLPRFDLGFHHTAGLTPDLGPIDRYDPLAHGAGGSGAIGYHLPYGTLPTFLGANARIEVGASYVRADASQSQSNPGFQNQDGFFPTFLNGTTWAPGVLHCGPSLCATSSTLSTTFTDWRLNGKLATDDKWGPVTITRSVALFGGQSTTNENFSQHVLGLATVNYSASVATRWTDLGARFGLDGRLDVTPWLAFGLGGSVGVAHRDVSLIASDFIDVLGPPGGTAINATRVVNPFLGNAEARVFVTPWSNITLKGFIGLNYDNMVPGISSPTFAGPVSPAVPVGTPANIKFEAETSYYAGVGLLVRFP